MEATSGMVLFSKFSIFGSISSVWRFLVKDGWVQKERCFGVFYKKIDLSESPQAIESITGVTFQYKYHMWTPPRRLF